MVNWFHVIDVCPSYHLLLGRSCIHRHKSYPFLLSLLLEGHLKAQKAHLNITIPFSLGQSPSFRPTIFDELVEDGDTPLSAWEDRTSEGEEPRPNAFASTSSWLPRSPNQRKENNNKSPRQEDDGGRMYAYQTNGQVTPYYSPGGQNLPYSLSPLTLNVLQVRSLIPKIIMPSLLC